MQTIISQYSSGRYSSASKNMFRNLAMMWALFILLSFVVIMAFASNKAHAEIVMNIHQVAYVAEPASFTQFIPSPTATNAQEMCRKFLHPHTQPSGALNIGLSGRIQRNAETQPRQTIEAIKAYRQCISNSVLNTLASR